MHPITIQISNQQGQTEQDYKHGPKQALTPDEALRWAVFCFDPVDWPR